MLLSESAVYSLWDFSHHHLVEIESFGEYRFILLFLIEYRGVLKYAFLASRDRLKYITDLERAVYKSIVFGGVCSEVIVIRCIVISVLV